VASKRQTKTLLVVNVLFAASTVLTDVERSAGEKLPLMRQAQVMMKAMPKATRVAEFVSLWAIAKYHEGEVTTESLAAFWNQPERTMYRRLEEFREVWAPVPYETPDALADNLIAGYRARRERLAMNDLVKLLSAEVSVPGGRIPAVA
jgi:hypothetical protein